VRRQAICLLTPSTMAKTYFLTRNEILATRMFLVNTKILNADGKPVMRQYGGNRFGGMSGFMKATDKVEQSRVDKFAEEKKKLMEGKFKEEIDSNNKVITSVQKFLVSLKENDIEIKEKINTLFEKIQVTPVDQKIDAELRSMKSMDDWFAEEVAVELEQNAISTIVSTFEEEKELTMHDSPVSDVVEKLKKESGPKTDVKS